MKILFTFFYILNLNAQVLTSTSVREMVEEIKIINTGKLANPIAPMCLNTLADTNNQSAQRTNSMFNKCAVDLCDVPTKNPSVYFSDDSYSKFLTSRMNKKIEKEVPTIQKIIDKSLAQKKSELNAMKEFVKDPQKAYSNFSSIEKINFDLSVFSNFIQTDFTNSKNIEDRIKMHVSPPSWADENFKKALNTYAEEYKTKLFSDPESLEKLKLTDSEYKKHIDNLTLKVESSFKQHPEGLDKNQIQDLNRLKSQTDANKLDRNKLDEKFYSIITLEHVLKENIESKTGSSGLCNTPECQQARKSYFQSPSFTSSLSKYEQNLYDPQTKIQAQNHCKASLVSSEIEESDERKAAEIYKESLNLIKTKYLSRFSTHSREMLEKYLDNSLTTTAGSLASLDAKKDHLGIFKEKAHAYLNNPSPVFDNQSMATDLFKINESLAELDPTAGNHPCAKYATTVWDAFLSVEKVKAFVGSNDPIVKKTLKNKDRIFISPFTCQHSDHGKHNTAHEIGHALNIFFKLNKVSESSAKFFNELRACATSNYTNISAAEENGFIHAGDSILTEEDHADLIAFIAVEDKRIYSCSFLKPSLDLTKYIDLDFKNRMNDPHSNPFSRVILEAVNKDIPLPKSCQDLIQEVKPEMRLKKCI